MKKLPLLFSFVALALGANAQVTLTGSSYTQNFDAIGTGIPTGWHLFTGSSANSLGTDVTSTKYNASPVYWSVLTGGFRNSASADAFTTYASADSVSQASATNRALSVRQVSPTNTNFPNSDSGAAFVLELANTQGLTNFSLNFKLQSLDSSNVTEGDIVTHTITWQVDYGFGATPTTFTVAPATGTLTTGGHTYSNNTVTVNFGSALDNQTGPVYIRIVTILYGTSSGSGNRPTTGIDDYTLSYDNTDQHPNLLSFTPANNATGVATTSNLTMTFDHQIAKGTGAIHLKNETNNTTLDKDVSSSDVTVNGAVVTVGNLGLLSGKSYHVTFDSTAFDTASNNSHGVYDTATWRFSTIGLGVANTALQSLPLSVINNSTVNQINLIYSVTAAGNYYISIYDITGREVAKQTIYANQGTQRLSVDGLNLHSGMYIVKMGNNTTYGIAKAILQ